MHSGGSGGGGIPPVKPFNIFSAFRQDQRPAFRATGVETEDREVTPEEQKGCIQLVEDMRDSVNIAINKITNKNSRIKLFREFRDAFKDLFNRIADSFSNADEDPITLFNLRSAYNQFEALSNQYNLTAERVRKEQEKIEKNKRMLARHNSEGFERRDPQPAISTGLGSVDEDRPASTPLRQARNMLSQSSSTSASTISNIPRNIPSPSSSSASTSTSIRVRPLTNNNETVDSSSLSPRSLLSAFSLSSSSGTTSDDDDSSSSSSKSSSRSSSSKSSSRSGSSDSSSSSSSHSDKIKKGRESKGESNRR
jgi:hypothetical protein